MLGEFLARCLVLVLGFAYPAFQCFKSVEKNRMDNQELRFWCQYWIIVAILTVCEGVTDIAFAWLPVYDELKLGFIIYLWHSKFKGTSHIYETILRPYVTGHETDIEVKLQMLKVRVMDVAVYYWQNWTDLGQSAMFQVLDYVSGRSGRFPGSRIEENKGDKKRFEPSAPPMPPTIGDFPTAGGRDSRRRPPRGGSGTTNRAISEPTQSNLFQVLLNEKTETLQDDASYTFPEADLPAEDKAQHSRTARLFRRS